MPNRNRSHVQQGHMTKEQKRNYHGRILLSSIIIIFIAAGMGFLFTYKAIDTWYPTLNKPDFNPPNGIFGPVWTIVYLMMAFALYFVRIKVHIPLVKTAETFFYIQLFFNALWSFLFFFYHSPILALIDIFILWILIIITTILFYKNSIKAAALMIPYLLWVTFAAYLNYTIWWMN